MTNSQRLAKVRARLLQWIADQQPDPATAIASDRLALDPTRDATAAVDQKGQQLSEPAILRETILIRDEHFCGRHFYTAAHHAIWFIEEDQLKVFSSEGKLLCVLGSQAIDDAGGEETLHPLPKILKISTTNNDGAAAASQQQARRAA